VTAAVAMIRLGKVHPLILSGENNFLYFMATTVESP